MNGLICIFAATLSAVPGDLNEDGACDLGDALYVLNYVFLEGPPPPPPAPVLSTGSRLCPRIEVLIDVPVPCPGEDKVRTEEPPCIGDVRLALLIECDRAVQEGVIFARTVPPWDVAVDGNYAPGVERALRDRGDGTVEDLSTGLVWTRGPVASSATLPEAVRACEVLVLGGADDWRLPTVAELETLVDRGRSSPALSPLLDPGAGPPEFWSSTPFAEVEEPGVVREIRFWRVEFARGRVLEAGIEERASARAVRGRVR